jgi:23S rRNA-/tRNA-specific pseudouridylate synthase
LRIQCANRGIPIVGDRTYGDFTKNRNSKAQFLFLHSESIELALGAGTFKSCIFHPEYFKSFH